MPPGQSESAPSTSLSTSDTPPGAADSRGETLSPAAQLQSSAVSTYLDRPPLPANLSTLSASARTSYTRVDLSNMDSEVPVRGDNGDELLVNPGVEERSAVDGPGVDSAVPDMPQVSLTFLLVSGRRRTMSFDQEMTVGRVKELVWNAWPNGECLIRFLCRRKARLVRAMIPPDHFFHFAIYNNCLKPQFSLVIAPSPRCLLSGAERAMSSSRRTRCRLADNAPTTASSLLFFHLVCLIPATCSLRLSLPSILLFRCILRRRCVRSNRQMNNS